MEKVKDGCQMRIRRGFRHKVHSPRLILVGKVATKVQTGFTLKPHTGCESRAGTNVPVGLGGMIWQTAADCSSSKQGTETQLMVKRLTRRIDSNVRCRECRIPTAARTLRFRSQGKRTNTSSANNAHVMMKPERQRNWECAHALGWSDGRGESG